MAIYHIDVPNGEDLSLLKDEYYVSESSVYPRSQGRQGFDNKFIHQNKDYWESPCDKTYDFGNIILTMYVTVSDRITWAIKRKSDSQTLVGATWDNGGGREVIEFYLDFGVDETTKKGYFIVASIQSLDNNQNWQDGVTCQDGGRDLYDLLVGTSNSGGAGSGYIGNSLVSNKKMVGYNVPTSSAESTKTESVNEASESPVSGKPKIGNGYAKIKFLREI